MCTGNLFLFVAQPNKHQGKPIAHSASIALYTDLLIFTFSEPIHELCTSSLSPAVLYVSHITTSTGHQGNNRTETCSDIRLSVICQLL